MIRLDLDFAGSARRGRWLGIGLLLVASVATAKMLHIYSSSTSESNLLEARIAQLERRAGGARAERTPVAESTLREIRHANEVIGQIALPWDRLFKAVEAAASNKVGLLGITPDQKGGTVEVSGECADLQTMFDYVKRLDRQASLGRVYLLNHQINAQDPQRPVRFTVTASWLQPKSAL
jgi:Tfp pilus assembly protein PilN